MSIAEDAQKDEKWVLFRVTDAASRHELSLADRAWGEPPIEFVGAATIEYIDGGFREYVDLELYVMRIPAGGAQEAS